MKEALTEKQRNTQQVPFRLHVNDYKLLRKLLLDEGLTFQGLMGVLVQAYLKGDPPLLRLIKDWRDINSIPREERDKFTLSHRERAKMLDEIAEAEEDEERR